MAMQKLTLQELEIEKPKVLPSEFLRIGWTIGRLAESDEKEDDDLEIYIAVEPNNLKAVSWCALGAFCIAFDISSETDFIEYNNAMYHFLTDDNLLNILGFEIDSPFTSITDWNDTMELHNILEVVEAIELHLGWR